MTGDGCRVTGEVRVCAVCLSALIAALQTNKRDAFISSVHVDCRACRLRFAKLSRQLCVLRSPFSFSFLLVARRLLEIVSVCPTDSVLSPRPDACFTQSLLLVFHSLPSPSRRLALSARCVLVRAPSLLLLLVYLHSRRTRHELCSYRRSTVVYAVHEYRNTCCASRAD